MARVRSQQPILPSLLDRLIDEDPQEALEAPKSAAILLKEIKVQIRRDLENLLNTRLYRQQALGAYSELKQSVVNYGLPDFSRVQFGSATYREEFRLTIENTIRMYEPRFRRVHVEIAEVGEQYERTLYLKITALLMVEPDPVPVLFDSRIRALDRALKLQELRRG
ncbi:MAG: type VI secretion system baseplate subunit TssE [Gammaproteobacteria bacterium]|nr:type VI secretion system baseplate subunit TssE [Gammaproteobacteria bacterium]